MNANFKKKDRYGEDVALTAYIWPNVRTSIVISWFILQIISITTYALFISWLKTRALNSHLSTSNAVISEAIEVGDWDFALNALKANSSVGDVFALTLGSADDKTIYAGPFGKSPLGLGTYCGDSTAKTKVKGCIKLLGLLDLLNLSAFIAVSILFSLFAILTLRHKFLGTLEQVADSLTEDLEANPSGIKEVTAVHQRIRTLMKEREISSNQKALAELAAQVAHDIRSPLGALKIIAAKFSSTDLDQKSMVNSATQRIEDIASKLLDRHRADKTDLLGPIKIMPLLENIIREKRISYPEFKISFSTVQPQIDSEILVILEPKEFSIIISNIVNNATESFVKSSGEIKVSVQLLSSKCVVRISDDGLGMSKELLQSVGRIGFRSTKSSGSGLGLLHARSQVESWGGSNPCVSRVLTG